MRTRAYVMHIGETVVLFMCVSHRVHFTRKLKTGFEKIEKISSGYSTSLNKRTDKHESKWTKPQSLGAKNDRGTET